MTLGTAAELATSDITYESIGFERRVFLRELAAATLHTNVLVLNVGVF